MPTTIVHPWEVFKGALLANSVRIVCIHNHPSGSSKPLPRDIETIEILQKVGDIVGVKLLEHIIIGSNGYSSMTEDGILEKHC